MDSSLISQKEDEVRKLESSATLLLLKRGLEYIQQGCYEEAATLFTVAREQLPANQTHLEAMLATFLQGMTEYQHTKQALHKAGLRFAEICKEQQMRAKAFAVVVPPLLDTLHEASQPIISTSIQSLSHSVVSHQNFRSSESATRQEPVHRLSITCFGRFEVKHAGKPVTLCPSRSGQGILRYLVAKTEHSATSDTLQGLFWPEDGAEVAQRKLHNAVSALRRSLNENVPLEACEEYIVCKNHVYFLIPTTFCTDVDDFLHYHQLGLHNAEERIASYEKACRLYKGALLPEDMYADWSFLQREQLSRNYLTMCKALATHYLKVHQYEYAEQYAMAMLKEDRGDEDAHRRLMQTYAAQGCRSEVRQQYQRCERILREEFGVQPLPETQALFHTLMTNNTPSF